MRGQGRCCSTTRGGVVGASVLVACGDDDEGESLSKSEFIAQADAVCSAVNDRFDRLFDTDRPTTRAAIPGFWEKAAALGRRQQSGLKALDPPEADSARIERLLATGDKAVADYEKASRDAALGAELFNEEGGANTAAFERQADAYGLKECGEDEEEDDEDEPEVDRSGFSAGKKTYIEKADAVCREANEKFSESEERHLKAFPPPLEVWGEFLPEIAEIGRDLTAELEKIVPPPADEAKINQLLARQKALIAQLERAGRTAAAGDEEAFQEQSRRAFAAGDEIDAELRAYGFRQCGAEGEE